MFFGILVWSLYVPSFHISLAFVVILNRLEWEVKFKHCTANLSNKSNKVFISYLYQKSNIYWIHDNASNEEDIPFAAATCAQCVKMSIQDRDIIKIVIGLKKKNINPISHITSMQLKAVNINNAKNVY